MRERPFISFGYVIHELGRKNGYGQYQVILYRLGKYDLKEVAQEKYNFKTPVQAAMELAESKGLFKPAKRHESGSQNVNYVSDAPGFTYCGNARFKQI